MWTIAYCSTSSTRDGLPFGVKCAGPTARSDSCFFAATRRPSRPVALRLFAFWSNAGEPAQIREWTEWNKDLMTAITTARVARPGRDSAACYRRQ